MLADPGYIRIAYGGSRFRDIRFDNNGPRQRKIERSFPAGEQIFNPIRSVNSGSIATEDRYVSAGHEQVFEQVLAKQSSWA
jgi:hypothetical protein